MREWTDIPPNLRKRLESLSPETRQMLEERVRHLRRDGRIPPAEGSIPLSFSQERVWFLDQLKPGSPLYHIKKGFRLRGPLDVSALRLALEKVVARHESLRTRIATTADGPEQVVGDPAALPFAMHDLSAEPEHRRSEALDRILRAEARRPFDLSRDLMLRCTVVRMGDEDHVMLLVIHHVAADRWSIEILLRELSAFYAAAVEGRSCDLTELEIRYADFAAWQRRRLSGRRLDELAAFWKERLADAAELELPSDRPHDPFGAVDGGRHAFSLPDELAGSVRTLAKQERATPNMVLLAAFQALLHRYTGQTDLVIGSPSANRDRRELEHLIGMFVSTLVVRTDVAGNPSFRELVGRARSAFVDAITYRDVPFEKLGLWTSERRQPLIRALFAMQNTPEPVLDLPCVDAESVVVSSGTAKFDLSLMIYDTGDRLDGSIRYNSALFDAATVERMAVHFRTLLASAVSDPDRPIGSLALQSEAERKRILERWNETTAPFPGCSVHALVGAQCARTPDAPAVVSDREAITYGELNARADHLAGVLRSAGIGDYVPVLVRQCVDLPAALLGIMKSGAAFVPIDADWPEERISKMLDALGAPIVVASERIPALLNRHVIGFDGTVHAVPSNGLAGVRSNRRDHDDPEAPLYAIYTSGSTGEPKAAVVPHRGIVNRLWWMNSFFGSESAAAVLQTTKPIYDSAIWQIFWPLINGGRTVVPSQELSPDYVAETVEAQQITLIDFVPSLFNELLTQLRSRSGTEWWRSLRFIILGGEELQVEHAHRALEQFPGVRLVNLYGPTEASIGCIFHEVTGRETDGMPIGRPISNASALVLDPYGHPVPVGTIGELYLGGACLGLGYLDDEAKTREVFVPNPFPEVRSEALYRTGDLACYGCDGEIYFKGRADRQIKIHGHRIEPAEIEAMLRRQPHVQEAVVTSHDAGRRLAAYVVLAPGAPSDAEAEIRGRLKNQLPAHMVPSAVVRIDTLPMLPNGKVDYRALPAPGSRPSERAFVAPRNDLERALRDIWSELLGVTQIGVHDDFFDLGGHSLMAMRLAARVAEICDVRVPLVRLFEAPTIAELASFVDAGRWAARAPRNGETHEKREEIQL